MKSRKILSLALTFLAALPAYAGQVTGQLVTTTGGPVRNATISLTLNAPNTVAGSFSVVTGPSTCYTDSIGFVVGEPTPLTPATLSQNLASGTLPAATYFVRFTWADSSGESAPSPESSFALTGTGSLVVSVPANPPVGATSWKIYIASSTGTETLQATQSAPFSNYSQSVPLSAGAALPSSNTTQCRPLFNDQFLSQPNWYAVSITTPSGAAIAGLSRTGKVYFAGGSSGIVNVSSGFPDYSPGGLGVFPTPIFSTPAAGAQQTINGALTLGANPFTAGAFNNIQT